MTRQQNYLLLTQCCSKGKKMGVGQRIECPGHKLPGGSGDLLLQKILKSRGLKMLQYFQHLQRAICHLHIWWITSYYTVSAKQCRLKEVKHLQCQLQNNKTDCLSSKSSTCQRLRAGIGSLLNCLSYLRGKCRLRGHAVLWASACATGCPPQTHWQPPPWQ